MSHTIDRYKDHSELTAHQKAEQFFDLLGELAAEFDVISYYAVKGKIEVEIATQRGIERYTFNEDKP